MVSKNPDETPKDTVMKNRRFLFGILLTDRDQYFIESALIFIICKGVVAVPLLILSVFGADRITLEPWNFWIVLVFAALFFAAFINLVFAGILAIIQKE